MDVLINTYFLIMSPGPTQVADNVYRARSLRTTNPDLDPAFYDFYRDTCHLFGKLIHTKNACFILGGEGILGLEAACASLTEPGDRVLVIDNGIFGKGFADFVSMYQWLAYYDIPTLIVGTKIDKVKPNARNRVKNDISKTLDLTPKTPLILFSAVKKQGKDQVWNWIEQRIGEEQK